MFIYLPLKYPIYTFFFLDFNKTILSSEEENFCRYREVCIYYHCSIFVGIGGCCPCSGGSNRRLVAGREEWKQQPMPQ